MFEILLIATIIFVEISGTTRARRDLKNSSPGTAIHLATSGGGLSVDIT
jgi:hypothetical protein